MSPWRRSWEVTLPLLLYSSSTLQTSACYPNHQGRGLQKPVSGRRSYTTLTSTSHLHVLRSLPQAKVALSFRNASEGPAIICRDRLRFLSSKEGKACENGWVWGLQTFGRVSAKAFLAAEGDRCKGDSGGGPLSPLSEPVHTSLL